MFYQLGVEPVRIDIMTSASGWDRRTIVDFDGTLAGVLSKEDLLISKKAADRTRDRKHVRSLQKPRKSK